MQSPKRILYVTGGPAGLEQARQWEAQSGGLYVFTATVSLDDARQRLAKSSFNAIIADAKVQQKSGVEFLDETWRQQPRIARFLRADHADQELLTTCALSSHQVLPKPLDYDNLAEALQRVFFIDELIDSRSMVELVSRVRAFPCLPSVYFELMKELSNPAANHKSVGALIAKDLAINTKLIQLVNSAGFGLQRQITDPAEAVMVLGMDTIRSLVVGIHAFAQADKIKPVYFSIQRVWQHCLAVAQIAQRLTLRVTGDEVLAASAYTAGMLHDLGKLVFATNFDQQYGNVLALAKKQGIAPVEIERQIFGVTHAETGAYMFSLWGLPAPIVEAAAFHHEPSKSHHRAFSPLAAVHAANVLEHERNPRQDGFIDPAFDQSYFSDLNLARELPLWRAEICGVRPEAAAPEATDPPASEDIIAAKIEPAHSRPRSRVPVAAAVVLMLVVFAAWKMTRGTTTRGGSVPSTPPRITKATVPTSISHASENAPINSSASIPLPEVLPENVSTNSLPVPEAAQENASSNTPATLDSTPLAEGFDAVKVQAIFFRTDKPAVVINGKMLNEGETIQGVRVVEIQRENVLLQYGDERQAVPLRQ